MRLPGPGGGGGGGPGGGGGGGGGGGWGRGRPARRAGWPVSSATCATASRIGVAWAQSSHSAPVRRGDRGAAAGRAHERWVSLLEALSGGGEQGTTYWDVSGECQG